MTRPAVILRDPQPELLLVASPAPAFVPSPQQAAVFEWVLNGTGSAFVEAVAGAGKTTTLIGVLKLLRGSVAFVAYNTKIVAEIKARVAKLEKELGVSFSNLRVGTFHSFGFQAWRRVHPGVKSGPEAAREKRDMMVKKLVENKVPEGLHGFILKLVSLAKQRAIGLHGSVDDESLWYDIVDHFDLAFEIEDQELIADGVKWAIRALKYHVALAPKIIDFDDMCYMPVVTGCRMWENDWILVDEAQDTNPARRALARKMLRPSGRAVFVGDRHQAIYGFTGADADAIEQIMTSFNCATLPLTITYRCPKTVVTLAQTIVSHIEAHETAPEGDVRTIEAADLPAQNLTAADAILCRTTRPLVELAYQFIRSGVACHVEGKDIGMGLLKLVNRWHARDLDDLRDKMEVYQDREVAKLMAKGRETQAEALADRVGTVLAIADNLRTVDELRQRIASMFVDGDNEQKPTLTLATAHRSKGREWRRVFILGYHQLMPSRWARQQWQLDQENNLRYVAITRSQDELVLVNVPA